jgi:hypothetical protein
VTDYSDNEDMSYIELDQLNLPVLTAATNNFSKDNKLGEGGFGEVFKVHFLPCPYIVLPVFCFVCFLCILSLFSVSALLAPGRPIRTLASDGSVAVGS